ncbi:hypothetical protein SAMN05880582_11011 [Rhizobium sp. RU20A]|uniref:TfuA-like protein n=1 Tax=Rhizobium sp. RU20A TaxID=1907412 RepID=UPI000956ACE4|nr:TfuA-like protein [Rhizobium sp. RU20A]SIR31593.1 hypothetical protein SAMN05880582_11011 [Rhizobium sp. RU20A]
MKILFAGPTLPDAAARVPSGIVCRGPVLQGDVHAAVEDGASAIGIIDGGFEFTAPVWHKEILFALEAGVRVIGAASMGALRAVECEAFGMQGVGRVFEDYRAGRRIDDGDVAQLHGPEALGFLPLTEPLVNVSATLEALVAEGRLDEPVASELLCAAERLFFKDRTWAAIVNAVTTVEDQQRARLRRLLRHHRVDQKRLDALELVATLAGWPEDRDPQPTGWRFIRTSLWEEMLLLPRPRRQDTESGC